MTQPDGGGHSCPLTHEAKASCLHGPAAAARLRAGLRPAVIGAERLGSGARNAQYSGPRLRARPRIPTRDPRPRIPTPGREVSCNKLHSEMAATVRFDGRGRGSAKHSRRGRAVKTHRSGVDVTPEVRSSGRAETSTRWCPRSG